MSNDPPTVRGIEAVKLYMPPTKTKINTNVTEVRGRPVESTTPLTHPTVGTVTTMTSVERYRLEWEQLLRDLKECPERMCEKAFSGELKMSKFRSLYWALLLRVLNTDYVDWQAQRHQQRKRYAKLKNEYTKNPHETNAPDDNPLSQTKQSVWNQYFSNQELFAVIRQDVVRTFPGVDFFRKDIIQNAMTNILFYYAREHPYMSYRQGMHEILAPILFVIYSDYQSLLHFKEISNLSAMQHGDLLLDVLNPGYLEEDSYSIFSRLMSSIESYYRISQTFRGYSPIGENDDSSSGVEAEVISQLNLIRDKILAKEDLHLHNYLLKLDIPLQLFGIRWLRLLFGREFPILDLLVLWDAIFADSDRFDLPNYILVAMLIHIRDKLLLSDYTTCLTYLMRYPANIDISLILRHALHMLMPKKFERPANAFVYFTAAANAKNNDIQLRTAPKQAVAAPKSQTLKMARSVSLQQQEQQQLQRPSSTPPFSSGIKMEQQITLQQTRNAADDAALARLRGQAEAARVVMDGYLENSPELLRLELESALAIISLTRNKLQACMKVVRKHVVKQQKETQPAEELLQAIDGIDELNAFLDVKFMFPIHSRSKAPIDQAHEADEQHKRLNNTLKKSADAGNSALEAKQTVAAPSMQAKSEQLSSIGNFDNLYEKPDLNATYNSARLLGNLREIELITIATDEHIVEPITADRAQLYENVASSSSSRNDLPAADPLRPFENV